MPPFPLGGEESSAAVVYFIKAPGRIKIGFTTNLPKRLRNLSTASPEALSLIGSVSAGRVVERRLHALLQAHRTNGEWFTDCAEVQEVIHEAISGGLYGLLKRSEAKRSPNPLVVWASESLRKIVNPQYGETLNVLIQRAAKLTGLSYWRAFDLWYGKARRLEPAEQSAIRSILGEVS